MNFPMVDLNPLMVDMETAQGAPTNRITLSRVPCVGEIISIGPDTKQLFEVLQVIHYANAIMGPFALIRVRERK